MKNEYIFLILGTALIPFAAYVFKNPKPFLNLRTSQRWVRIIGEEKTIKMIQYLSAPLLLIFALICLGMGYAGLQGLANLN